MRLINTSTVQVELFSNDDAVKYGILSHRWEDGEVSLQDLATNNVGHQQGYQKIRSACLEARRANLQYIWIDTCCIDKTSSAELSEAINSMYRWYERAEICYAYLSDVDATADLESSAWFARGWTLQELVAPGHVKFYNRHWHNFGSKSGLQGRISSITNIPLNVLRGDKPAVCSVAQRMSWAAGRVTTRPEDKAYCLMGLFDVNMPMLYGEGAKAFIRLQEEIIKTSDDHSIFAWTTAEPGWRGVLAPSPACFHGGSKMMSTAASVDPEQYSITNVGLSIRLPLMAWTMNTYLAVLQCSDTAHNMDLMPHARQKAQYLRTGIFLRRTKRDKQYVRIAHSGRDLFEVDTSKFRHHLTVGSVLVLQRVEEIEDPPFLYGFLFRSLTATWFNDYKTVSRRPGYISGLETELKYDKLRHRNERWLKVDHRAEVFELQDGEQGLVTSFRRFLSTPSNVDTSIAPSSDKVGVINFSFDFSFNPVCTLYHVDSEYFQRLAERNSAPDDYMDVMENSIEFGNLGEDVKAYAALEFPMSWLRHKICVLVGDRDHGLSAHLQNLNLHIEVRAGWRDQFTKAWIVDVGAISFPPA